MILGRVLSEVHIELSSNASTNVGDKGLVQQGSGGVQVQIEKPQSCTINIVTIKEPDRSAAIWLLKAGLLVAILLTLCFLTYYLFSSSNRATRVPILSLSRRN
jgi:hypothetical protein